GCNGPAIIDVFSTGRIEIGDNSVNNSGILTISNGDVIHLWDGSTLIINDNSKLVIDDGATLIVDDGATILLQGENAELHIMGNLNIENNAIFTVAKGSGSDLGFVRFTNATIVANGTSSSINLQGTNKNHKLVVIEGELEIPSAVNPTSPGNYINYVTIQDARIEYCGDGTRLLLGNDFSIDNCLFVNVCFYTTLVDGIKIFGQSFASISNSDFVGFTNGLINENPNNGNILTLTDCNFTYCDIGIDNVNTHLSLEDCNFDYCKDYAILLEGVNNDSKFKNIWVNECGTGIKNTNPSGSRYIFIENSRFLYNDKGIDLTSINLNVKCTRFLYNSYGIKITGGLLNLNSGNTIYGSLYSSTGGYCTFGYNTSAGVYLNSSTVLYLENGYNNFLRDPLSSPPYNYLTGNIAYSTSTHLGLPLYPTYPLKATNNFWNPAPSPLLNSSNPNFYFVTFPFPGSGGSTINDFNGTMLSSLVTNCYDPNVIGGITEGNTDIKETHKSNSLKVYPNPSSDFLHIESSHQEIIIQVEIFDNLGNKIINITPVEASNDFLMKIGDLTSGSYVVKIITNQMVYQKTILVLK
ncbi:MAG: T9SS type A sorting domain-containing protein, partial [Bacteroidia bacterium]|nr:T9SS type A sorting domain-containing protein [Bacteroidia bacterium]